MANNQILKDDIASVIKTNGNNEITGDLLKNVLFSIVNQFGYGLVFLGVAYPETLPSNADVNGFYVAIENGIYVNFDGYINTDNKFVIFSNIDGAFKKCFEANINAPGKVEPNNINPVSGGEVYSSIDFLFERKIITDLEDGFVTTNGNIDNSYQPYTRTKYISVNKGDTIKYKGYVSDTTLCVAGYNSNFEFIKSMAQSTTITELTIRIDDDVKYIIMSSDKSADYYFEIIKIKDLEKHYLDKIITISEYIFPISQNNTIFLNQLTILNNSNLIFKSELPMNFNEVFTTPKTLQVYNANNPNSLNDLKVSIFEEGNVIDEKNIRLRTVRRDIGDGREIDIVVSGDSLVDQRDTACELYNLLNIDGDYTINQLGTRIATMDGIDYKHEGRGAWSWNEYINPLGEFTEIHGKLNAFFYNGKLDFKNYATNQGRNKIDIFYMLLGTNDVMQGQRFMTDKELVNIIERAKKFINSFVYDFPNGKFIVGLPSIGGDISMLLTQPNIIFRNSIQRLNKMYIDTFDNGKYHNNVSCVHYGAYIDTKLYNNWDVEISDYTPADKVLRSGDNIHPINPGYKQFGRGLYCNVRGILNDFFY